MVFSLVGIKKQLLYLVIISAFTGTLWLTLSVGPVHIFPYRIMMIILWCVLLANRGVINISDIRVRRNLQFLIIWITYSMLSIIWAADKVEAVKHIIFLFLNVSLVFFIVQLTKNYDDFKKLYNIWIAIFVILMPVAIWEIMTGDHLSNSGLLNVDEGYELYKFAPTTVFENQNDYSTLVGLTFPMFLVSIGHSKRLYSKIFNIVMALLCIVVLMFASSRANYIGIVLSFSFWFLFLLPPTGKFKLLLILFALILLYIPTISKEQMDFYSVVWDDFDTLLHFGREDAGVDIRSNLIKNGLYYSFASMGFGVGAGNIEYYIGNYPMYYVANITNVHNWWIEILANYGLIIFIGYLLFYMNIIWNLWEISRRLSNPKEKIICHALLCGLISFSISSLSSSSIMSFNPHWIYFGMALAFINYQRNKSIKSI